MWVVLLILLLLLASIGVFAFMFFRVYQRSRELPLLVKDGRMVQARVIQKSIPSLAIEGQSNLYYEFQDETGMTYRRMFAAPREQFDATLVGDFIEVVYLPMNPRISTGKYWVDRAR